MQKVLTTSEFADAIGISESSARRLSDSGSLRVQRTGGGHRKIPVSEAIRYVRENGIWIRRPDLLGLVVPPDGVDHPETHRERFTAALTDGNYRAVIGLMFSMYTEGVSIAEICDGPMHAAMTSVGNDWPSSKRSIFVEHRATMLCIRALCQIRQLLPETEGIRPKAIGGAPTDDPFLLPTLMVSLVLHECGFDGVDLGPNTPIEVLADAVEDEKPPVVWLAMTNPIGSRTLHRRIEELAELVARSAGTLFIGGRNASTYTGDHAVFCNSLQELSQRLRDKSG